MVLTFSKYGIDFSIDFFFLVKIRSITLRLLCCRTINKIIWHKVTVQFGPNERGNGNFFNRIAAEEVPNEAAFATTSTKVVNTRIYRTKGAAFLYSTSSNCPSKEHWILLHKHTHRQSHSAVVSHIYAQVLIRNQLTFAYFRIFVESRYLPITVACSCVSIA